MSPQFEVLDRGVIDQGQMPASVKIIRRMFWRGISPDEIAEGLNLPAVTVEAVLFARIPGREVEGRPVMLITEGCDDAGGVTFTASRLGSAG